MLIIAFLRSSPGNEPGTSSTQRRNHTTRPTRPQHYMRLLVLCFKLSSHQLQLLVNHEMLSTSNLITIATMFPKGREDERTAQEEQSFQTQSTFAVWDVQMGNCAFKSKLAFHFQWKRAHAPESTHVNLSRSD